MESVLMSALAVAVAEIGDKTQLLALMLAARYQTPIPIILGILVATILNHLAAAWLGAFVGSWLIGNTLSWIIGASFIAMAVWLLVPDKVEGPRMLSKAGPFLATTISFFIVEIGDKTQVATVLLAAKYDSVLAVTAGTTMGMLIANVPVVYLGDFISKRVSLKLVRLVSSGLFLLLGIAAILKLDRGILF